jgi:hypothetical protein
LASGVLNTSSNKVKIHMKTLSKTILAVLATGVISCGLFCPQVQAVPIAGNITFAGTVTLNPSDANTATQVTAWNGIGGSPQVQSADGSFTGLAGMNATFAAPWTFTSGLANFWSVGGFTFNLTTSSITSQKLGSLTVDGTGTITKLGFDPSAGSWHFTTQNPSANAQFSFSAATGTLPDGGSAVALLGIALAGIEGARRVLRARKA